MAETKTKRGFSRERPRHIFSRGGEENGIAMLFVVFAIMVVGILGALLLLYTSVALRNAVGVTPASRALAAAETGLDIAHARLASGSIEDSTTIPTSYLWDGKGSYTVTVQKNPDFGDGDPYDWKITSSGQYTANVEGVDRTYYRTVEEVVTFAGGRYYNALDYVLFSKEGNIDFDVSGDLGIAKVGGITVNGDIYAGKNVYVDMAAAFFAGGTFTINGDIITEKGDIEINEGSGILAAANTSITGDLYSGILARPGDLGGGVSVRTINGLGGGGSVTLTGGINSHGRLRDYDQGLRIANSCGFVGSVSVQINGSVKANRDVYIENNAVLAGFPSVSIIGSVHSGEDVNINNPVSIAGASVRTNVDGSIYAGGDVVIYGRGAVFAGVYNRVGGDIQAGGNVDIHQELSLGAQAPSGYVVGSDIYADSVDLYSSSAVIGSMSNSVGGSIYASGPFSLDNSATASTCNVTIAKSIYSTGNMSLQTSASWGGTGRVTVSGGGSVLNPPSPNPGVFANGTMRLSASQSWFANGRIDITRDARRYGGVPSISGNVNIAGATNQLASTFNVPSPDEPTAPTAYNEVLMPRCDFSYYREQAKSQMEDDGDSRHYVIAPAGGEYSLTLNPDDVTSSIYVVFCEGNLLINSVTVPVNTEAVFVATGNIRLHELTRQEGTENSKFQIIAGNKFTYDAQSNLSVGDSDLFFLYAAHETYDPVSDPVSVEYEMGWFKNLEGQITARGDIVLNSNGSYFRWLPLYNYTINYRNPAVLSNAFRIPFRVKSWKEL